MTMTMLPMWMLNAAADADDADADDADADVHADGDAHYKIVDGIVSDGMCLILSSN